MEEYSTPRQMKQVGDLFEKYRKHFKAPQATVEKACVQAIKEVTGYEVSVENVSYTVATHTISLRVPSVLKSELRFATSKILKQLEQKLGESGSPKVIL